MYKSKIDEKKRSRRQNRAMAIFIAACVLAVAVMPIYNIYTGDDADSWYVKGGHVEIASQPVETNAPENVENGQEEKEVTEPLPSEAPAMTAMQALSLPTEAPAAETTAEPVAETTAEPAVESTEEPAAESAEEPTEETTVEEAAVEPTAEPTPIPEVRTITITAVGDCTLGGNVPSGTDKRFDNYVDKYGYDYFFKGVRELFEADDLTIINLEGPLTTSKDMQPGRNFNFRGKPSYVKILTGSSIEICNVANNHSLDFGMSGLKETAKVLAEAGIGASGYDVAYTTEIKGVKITSLGFTQWDHKTSEIKKACEKARKDCDLLIVSQHVGRENYYDHIELAEDFAKAAIDGGADVVLGHHTHVYGGVEKYKGKYIVYSLGNFCFGGHGDPKDKDTMIFRQTFEIAPDGTVSDGGIDIIPASVTSTSGHNNFQPVILEKKQGEALLKKIARYSDISLTKTKWMPGSYMEYLGYANQPKDEKVYTSLIEALEAAD